MPTEIPIYDPTTGARTGTRMEYAPGEVTTGAIPGEGFAPAEEQLFVTADKAKEEVLDNQKKLAEMTTSTVGVDWAGYYRKVLENPTATEEAKAEARQKLATTLPTEKEEEKGITDEEVKALGVDETEEMTPEEKIEYERIKDEKEELDAQYQEAIDEIEQFRARASSTNLAIIASIQRQFAQRKKEMEEINRRTEQMYRTYGYRTESFRYSPTFISIISAEERSSVDRLNKLDIEEQGLILQAQQAHEAADWKFFGVQMAMIEKLRDEKTREFELFSEAIAERNEKIREQSMKVTREAAIIDLWRQGVHDPAQLYDYINFDEEGNLVGDITWEEITKITDKLNQRDKITNQKRVNDTAMFFQDIITKGKDLSAVDYLQAQRDWIGMGGSLSDFNAAFPVEAMLSSKELGRLPRSVYEPEKPEKPEKFTSAEKKEYAISQMIAKITGTRGDTDEPILGADGYISPGDWRDAKRMWTISGFSPEDFIKQFYIYINPAHPQDYGQREANYMRAIGAGESEEETKLDRESVSQLFGIPDDNNKTGFLGTGKTNKEKLDEIMDSISQYQAVGYSDVQILKMMQ